MTTHPIRANDAGGGEELRLLIVADEAVRAGYRDALAEIAGLRLVEVDSDLDALEVILTGAADLCVADADDPLLGGLNLLNLALTAPGGAGLPILLMAAPDGETKRSDALAAGAWDCLLKPVSPALAAERVQGAAQALRSGRTENPGKSSRPRVLFADPDTDFLRYALRALSDISRVDTAATAPEAAMKILRDKPALAVLAPSFHPILKRILEARPDDFPDVCEIVLLDDAARTPNAIPRTLDKQSLAEHVGRCLATVHPAQPAETEDLSALPAVLAASVERYFAVMTGEPAVRCEGEPAREAGAGIELSLPGASRPLRLFIELQCSAEMGARLAAAIGGAGATVTGQDRQNALNDVVSVAAGRLKTFCWEQRLGVEIGAPRAAADFPGPPPGTDPYWRGVFGWRGQTCALVLTAA